MKNLPLFLISMFVFLLGLSLTNYLKSTWGYLTSNELISPSINGSNVGLNQWFPQDSEEILGVKDGPNITAKSAFFIDTKTGEVLFSKNPHSRFPVASLVKVMTVLVGLEHRNMDEEFLVSTRASEMEPDKMLLLPGEKLTLKELLYGIFLVSANDAAEVIAEDTIGDRAGFIKLMNQKAAQLGMKETFFVNPTGLDADSGNSYSSAYDLIILTRYLIRTYPEVVEISRAPYVLLPKSANHQDYEMYSGINLLTTYPGVIGFKTGFTPEAGLTLITLVRGNEREVLGVILGSENRREEAKELLDYSFGK